MATQQSPLWQIAAVAAVTSAVVTGGILTLNHLANSTAPEEALAVSDAAINERMPVPGEPANSGDSPVINVVRRVEPAVVSVIISKDVPIMEQSFEEIPFDSPFGSPFNFRVPRMTQNGTELREVGGGTAFFVRSDGLLMTNKHVVSDPNAEYTVFLNDGRKLPAKVLARDPVNDIALLKVEGGNFPFLNISTQTPELGQTVIAIGNALGEFRNTVSVGVISGVGRSIVAGGLGSGLTEQLNSIIQTDAAINQGNSGGPLVDLRGNVLGMSTAVAGNAQNIAFAIPAEDLNRALQSYNKNGRILRPYLGVRYTPVTKAIQEEKKLPYDYGVIALKGDNDSEPAVVPGSPADKAGIRDGDVILEIEGQKLTAETTLVSLIQRKIPGDSVRLKILQKGQEKEVTVTLEEWKDE